MNEFAPGLTGLPADFPHPLPGGRADGETADQTPTANQAESFSADDLADHADIRQTLAGDQSAFARLMERHAPAVGRQMWRFSRDAGVRDELVQEVFVEVYFSLKNYRLKAPFTHWLRTIATRTGYHYWRKLDRLCKHIPFEEWDGAESRAAGPEHAAQAGQDEAQAAGAILFQLLSRLKAADRVVLTLMYYENCSVEEIARQLGWTKAMVKMRAFRARKRMKVLIENHKLDVRSL